MRLWAVIVVARLKYWGGGGQIFTGNNKRDSMHITIFDARARAGHHHLGRCGLGTARVTVLTNQPTLLARM